VEQAVAGLAAADGAPADDHAGCLEVAGDRPARGVLDEVDARRRLARQDLVAEPYQGLE
jgi:hypothetical protein